MIHLLMTTLLTSFICAEDNPSFFQPAYISNRSLLETLWKKSPFERKVTPSMENVVASAYVMTGFGEIGNKRYVSVFNSTTKERLMLSEESQNGARLVDFSPNTDAAKTTATIEINGESFFAKFDSTIASTPPPPSPNVPQPPSKPFLASEFPQPTIQTSNAPEVSAQRPPRSRGPRRLYRNLKFENLPPSE